MRPRNECAIPKFSHVQGSDLDNAVIAVGGGEEHQVPYSDLEIRKRMQREAQARRRAKLRSAVDSNGLTSTLVNPTAASTTAPILPHLAPPSAADIDYVCRLLNVIPFRGDTPEKLHMRAKMAWQRLLRVVEE